MIVTFLKLIINLIPFLALSSQTTTYMWNYAEPNTDWGTTCTNGLAQSPIDFPTNFTLYNQDLIVKITSVMGYGQLKNGLLNGTLTIQNNRYIVTGVNMGSIEILKNGILYSYDLTDISFHLPSEHTFIKGYNGALEMHINHKKNAAWLQQRGIVDPDSKNTDLNIAIILVFH